VNVGDLPTPALVLDQVRFERNLSAMAAVLPGARLRPHVKAHKCTAIAAAQRRHGHESFTCATPREMLGMAAAGMGGDLLLANEVLDRRRLEAMAAVVAAAPDDVRMIVAVDSEGTIDTAAAAGLREVVVDVDVGLPRCGCAPADAGRLADHARGKGLTVRGVMGYEGHLMMEADRDRKREAVEAAVDALLGAHAEVGGELVSSGGTGTFDLHHRVTEVQAGSYALMDTQYATLEFGALGRPFELALAVVGTVISVRPQWAVVDVGLKALGMDHGNPSVDGATVWFCSDEHLTFAPEDGVRAPALGDRVRVWPAHIDPTMAKHEEVHVVDGDDQVVDVWPVDLRGW
jgi:D-serine deaminase-like pyridoxal phosphate-dependent protein